MPRPSRKTPIRLAGAVLLLVLAWLSPRAVPYNMDEFVHYHALGCATAPLQKRLPLIRDGCGYHDLRLPGTTTFLPLRSYLYTGSAPSLPFYPFWRLLDDPVSVRVQGAVFFLIFLFLASRLLRARPSSVLLAALVYPVFLATFVVDEGPIGLSVLLLLAALLAVNRSLGAGERSSSVAWAAIAGAALFLGLWTKLIFVWWLPAAAGYALVAARRSEGGLRAVWSGRRAALGAGVAAFVVPSLLLLASVDREGHPYAAVLGQGKISADAGHIQSAAGRLLPYLVDGARVAPRNVLLVPSVVDVLPLVLACLVLVLSWQRRARRGETAGWLAAAALTFGLASSSAYSQWPHHFAFPLLLFVLAVAVAVDGLAARARGALALGVILVFTTLAVRLPTARFPNEASPAKDELLALVRARGLDRGSLQLHTSWGTYYIAQLFGDRDRLLLYMRGATEDPVRLELARSLARAWGRSVLVFSSRRWERIQTPAVDAALGRPQATWRVGDWWAVEYQPREVTTPSTSAPDPPKSPRP